jgi:hypothetical protein
MRAADFELTKVVPTPSSSSVIPRLMPGLGCLKLAGEFGLTLNEQGLFNHWRSLTGVCTPPQRCRRFVVVRCSTVIDKPECVTMFDDVSDAQQRLLLK